MPFVLLALGLLFLVVAMQGTQGGLFALLKSEFSGTNSFIPWIAAILILGLLGYVKPIRPVTHAFIALIFLVLILANGGGFFSRFNQAIANPVAPTGATPGSATPGGAPFSLLAPALAGPSATAPSSGGLTGGPVGQSQVIDVFGPQQP